MKSLVFLSFSSILLLFSLSQIEAAKTKKILIHNHLKIEKPSEDDFIGCPLNNDFYYSGTINSPQWPYNYPPNDKCYYYLTSKPGTILKISFSHYDVELCCDYVTIYDGETEKSSILVQIGGPGSNVTKPSIYYTTTRKALMTFQSNPTIQKTGFSMQYESTNIVAPCKRDIFLTINGMAGVGSQSNFRKQINFFANQLTPTWQVGMTKVRVMMNLQVDSDYGLIWSADDLPDNTAVSTQLQAMLKDVPNVLDNKNRDTESLFRYSYDGLSDPKTFDERKEIDKVAIILLSENPNNDQDYNEAYEFSHLTRTNTNAKIILIGVGTTLNRTQIAALASTPSDAFFVSNYDGLGSIVSKINQAICTRSAQCGP